MGFFDFLASRGPCPQCGNPGASSLFGKVRCPNSGCPSFDPQLSYEAAERAGSGTRAAGRRPIPQGGKTSLEEAFDPARHGVEVRYVNFKGEDKTFTADRRSLRPAGVHLSLRVAPRGTRIALLRERIRNLRDLEAHLKAPVPPHDAQVLRYHMRHGTTSRLYEELRRKYPDFTD